MCRNLPRTAGAPAVPSAKQTFWPSVRQKLLCSKSRGVLICATNLDWQLQIRGMTTLEVRLLSRCSCIREDALLPTECALCLGSLTFQVGGVAVLGIGMLCRGDRPRSLRLLLLISIFGLGTLTVLSAVAQSTTALTAGMTLTMLMLGAIHPLSHDLHADAYASLYPPEG